MSMDLPWKHCPMTSPSTDHTWTPGLCMTAARQRARGAHAEGTPFSRNHSSVSTFRQPFSVWMSDSLLQWAGPLVLNTGCPFNRPL